MPPRGKKTFVVFQKKTNNGKDGDDEKSKICEYLRKWGINVVFHHVYLKSLITLAGDDMQFKQIAACLVLPVENALSGRENKPLCLNQYFVDIAKMLNGSEAILTTDFPQIDLKAVFNKLSTQAIDIEDDSGIWILELYNGNPAMLYTLAGWKKMY